MLAEDIPDSDIFFFQIPMSSFASDTSYSFLRNYKKVLTHYKKFHMDFYFARQDSFEVGESILKALLERPGFGRDVNKNILKWSRKLILFAKYTASLPLAKYSNLELWKLYDEHDSIHTKLYTYGWLPVSVDMFHNNFTKKLKAYLYSVCDSREQAENAFVLFTTPSKKTIVAKEREEFLKIYAKHKSNLKKTNSKLMAELTRHQARWRHMGYIYVGNTPPFSVKYYFEQLIELKRSKVNPIAILRKEKQQLRDAKYRQAALHKKLKINPQHRKLFQTANDFALTKLIRRHAQLLDLYLLHKTLLTEIAKRLKLERYEVQFMLKDEVRKALTTGKADKRLLQIRLRECVLYTEKNFETVYVGREAKRITDKLKNMIDTKISELTGQTAQPGYAKGLAKIIIRAKDMKKMNQGDILLSIATDPDIVPAMKKAAAIVTEQGGITSHAAIVSRELGIPCVIGTKIATKIFKDGDLVEVDANRGIVKKLS